MGAEVTEAVDRERTPYQVNIEPMQFEPDSEGKYLTSVELCQLTRDIFRAIFADFYGCKFELIQGVPSISLFFSHIDAAEDAVVATAKSSAKTFGNKVIDKTRGRDHLLRDGDRYVLTDDGVDVLQTVVLPMYLDKNRKLDQKRITSEVADVEQGSMWQQVQQTHLTKVSGIDPRRIAGLIWGTSDDEGSVDYGVTVLKDMAVTGMAIPGMFPSNFVLQITRAHTEAIKKTYNKFYMSPGSSIIR